MSCEVFLCGEEMKAVARFKYLGMMMIADEDMEEEVPPRVLEGRKLWGG